MPFLILFFLFYFPYTLFLYSIFIARCDTSPLLLTTVWYFLRGVLHFLPVYFPCDGHPSLLQLPVTTNNASVLMHVSLRTSEKVGMWHTLSYYIVAPQSMSIFHVTTHCPVAPECLNYPHSSPPHLPPASIWHHPVILMFVHLISINWW